MVKLNKTSPQIPVVLASLILWGSFAWGLPAEVEEGDNEPAVEDIWAGVRISDVYDYAKCPNCGKKNEIRAATCKRWRWSGCGKALPQPSAEVTDPEMVFVPGLGYYKEGALLEPPRTRKVMLVTGLVLAGMGMTALVVSATYESDTSDISASVILTPIGLGLSAAGILLFMFGIKKSEPVYAFASGEGYEPYDSASYARRSPAPDGTALKVEMTLLSF